MNPDLDRENLLPEEWTWTILDQESNQYILALRPSIFLMDNEYHQMFQVNKNHEIVVSTGFPKLFQLSVAGIFYLF